MALTSSHRVRSAQQPGADQGGALDLLYTLTADAQQPAHPLL